MVTVVLEDAGFKLDYEYNYGVKMMQNLKYDLKNKSECLRIPARTAWTIYGPHVVSHHAHGWEPHHRRMAGMREWLGCVVSNSKGKLIMVLLGIFCLATFLLQVMPSGNPALPDLPYGSLYDGGMGLFILLGIFWYIPKRIDKLEKNLLGSLLKSYSQFRDELRKRLTKTPD